jgi:hypothetical protein
MRPARARVVGRFDHAARVQEATVTMDRAAELFEVRPLRSRKVYRLPLSTVAEMVVQRLIKTEIMLARFEKAKKRKSRRGR